MLAISLSYAVYESPAETRQFAMDNPGLAHIEANHWLGQSCGEGNMVRGMSRVYACRAMPLFGISDSFRIARFHAMVLVMSVTVIAAVAQAPRSSGKATERVVRQYEKLIADGALLTPDGWKKTSGIFGRSNPYPENGEVQLTSQAGLIGEVWVRGDRAEVERKWTDFSGSIDSDLRYKPAVPTIDVIPAIYDYSLEFTNRHVEIEEGGSTSEVMGPWGWKIEGPQSERWATVEKAIIYVRKMRDKSDDPAIKKNANKTIAILKRLKAGCGSGSAC